MVLKGLHEILSLSNTPGYWNHTWRLQKVYSVFNISDAPVCSSDADQLIGVTADESISINCRVRLSVK